MDVGFKVGYLKDEWAALPKPAAFWCPSLSLTYDYVTFSLLSLLKRDLDHSEFWIVFRFETCVPFGKCAVHGENGVSAA